MSYSRNLGLGFTFEKKTGIFIFVTLRLDIHENPCESKDLWDFLTLALTQDKVVGLQNLAFARF